MSSAEEAVAIARKLKLAPIPSEGGYFNMTFQSKETMPNPERLGGGRRAVVTVIYFMLFRDFNTMHRMGTNEVWTYHGGSTLTLYQLKEDGTLITHKLGNVLEAEENQPQIVIETGCWMAAELKRHDDYVLVSCTVAPGFEPNDSKFPNRDMMCAKFPQHRDLFMRLIRVKANSADPDLAYMSPPLV
jgi:predicted cupin superfamily sugar epimerase